ncbi:MAG: hypothetical protein KatS3mg031_1677 [Chitinophagales bacterium]|nr:MAG: hypothetical protein KatS3mg031_1677 [Chitinophagales bacterium]
MVNAKKNHIKPHANFVIHTLLGKRIFLKSGRTETIVGFGIIHIRDLVTRTG